MTAMTLSPLLWVHFGLDLVCVGILVFCIYRRYRPWGGANFSLVMLNIVTFCLASLLSSVSIDIGVSLGLFAIFGILRYRTSPMKIGDLTYVFIVIGLAVINGIGIGEISWVEALILNVIILAVAWMLEEVSRRHGRGTLTLRYDRIDLVVPSRRSELLSDLSERLGLSCTGVNVLSVNLLMSTAELVVEFEEDTETREEFSAGAQSSFSSE